MAMRKRTLTLSSSQHENLSWHRNHDGRPYVRERCAAMLKIAHGDTPHRVAKHGLLKLRDPDTVYAWLDRYEAEGLDGLISHQHGGYHGSTLKERRSEVEERLHRPPDEPLSTEPTQTPAVTPCRYRLRVIRQTFDWLSDYTLSGVWRVLQRLRIGWKHGYVRHWSPDPLYLRKLKRIEKCLKQAVLSPSEVVALFLDEMSYYRWPTAARDWWPNAQGYPLAEHGNCNNQQWRLIGALNPCTGRVSYLQGYKIGRGQVIQFHQKLVADYPNATKIYLIEDNWNIHTHPDVQEALKQLSQIEVVWLPTYACWLNPIEKLWRWIRQEVLHRHRMSDCWDRLKHRVATFLDQFQNGSRELLHYVGLLGEGRFAKALLNHYPT